MTISHLAFDQEIIRHFCRSIVEDEFDDQSQNNHAYDGNISGYENLRTLIPTEYTEATENHRFILNVGSGGTVLTLGENNHIFNLDPCKRRSPEKNTINGWCENIISTPHIMDMIICWGVLRYARSLPESLISFNKNMRLGGHLILDTVTYTVMPLAQTAHPDCFVRYAELFGFQLHHRVAFGPSHHRREGYRFVKKETFDHRRLMIPQAVSGEINNYLPERDFYLK